MITTHSSMALLEGYLAAGQRAPGKSIWSVKSSKKHVKGGFRRSAAHLMQGKVDAEKLKEARAHKVPNRGHLMAVASSWMIAPSQ